MGTTRWATSLCAKDAMESRPIDSDRPDFPSWVKVTTFGWWLGFAVVLLLVLAIDAVAEVEGAQFMVGLGMGAGVGYLQGRRMNRWLGTRHAWFFASTVGMGGPFVVGDVARALGVGLPYSLALYVAVGSLLVGLLQWGVLRRYVSQAAWWVPGSMLGWMLPVGLMALNDQGILPGIAGEAVALIGMFFGGAILGAVTGGLLGRMLMRDAAQQAHAADAQAR